MDALSRLHLGLRWTLAISCVAASVCLGLVPGCKSISYLRDPALKNGAIPAAAWDLSASLAPRYAAWAQARVERANDPKTVAGTEWPLFGSVFYLQAMEALQEAWAQDHTLSPVAPAIYGRKAIVAAAALIVDPGQAKWVQDYYRGKDYLHHADLFYRYLLISGMTSYTRLTGDGKYLVPLRDQVESLATEIDGSPHGFVEDYPAQCYPPDIISALAAIKRADTVLQTNHGAVLQRALRAFTPPMADEHGLPYFRVMAESGFPEGPSRGSGNSFNMAATPAVWPAQSAAWYRAYTERYWQERDGIVGFREFADDGPPGRQFADVDSGPVILGFGVAASAFGVAAARAQGDLGRAGPLTAEMLATSCPLWGGSLLTPRLLSDAIDAPYLGESGILFCLTRPVPEGSAPTGAVITPLVMVAVAGYFGLSVFLLLPAAVLVREMRRARILDHEP
jgi:hypothetical protein